MKTGKTTIEIDGDKFTFNFEESGSKKGQGTTGEDDDKIYQSGMLLKAGSDEKYQVVMVSTVPVGEGENMKNVTTYTKLDDVEAFLDELGMSTDDALTEDEIKETDLSNYGITKKASDIDELYLVKDKADKDVYKLVNTSGKIVDKKSRNKDGNDYYYTVDKNGQILAIYTEQ